MKAYLKGFLLYFFKSASWVLLAAMATLIYARPVFTQRPVFCALLLFWFLTPVSQWRNERESSGYSVYESFSPVPVQKQIAAEYLIAFVLCMLFGILMRFGSPWIARLSALFPMTGLVFAAAEMPWFYLDRSRKIQIFVRALVLLGGYFIFASLREIPLVVPAYPLWMIIGINLLIILFYVLSGMLAVYFASKRR